MSASEPNRSEKPPHTPSREELAVAPTQALRPDEPSSQLVTLLDEYLAELQAGRRPDRQQLLAEHPELAAQLEQCLSGIEFIHRASIVRPTSDPLGQLGDFRIIREVGRGGMGVVYEAEQVSLKRRIALKVLRYGAASDTEAMQRFQREAETVATLHHTNIVPIFAIGCENGVNYYAMQFIEGRRLRANADLNIEAEQAQARAHAASRRKGGRYITTANETLNLPRFNSLRQRRSQSSSTEPARLRIDGHVIRSPKKPCRSSLASSRATQRETYRACATSVLLAWVVVRAPSDLLVDRLSLLGFAAAGLVLALFGAPLAGLALARASRSFCTRKSTMGSMASLPPGISPVTR